jgi:signal transduction histidine kinase
MPLYDFNLSQIVNIHKENINVLNQQLESNQIFLSMVVHDMRSPTVSVKLAFERLLELIRKTSEDLLNKNPGE